MRLHFTFLLLAIATLLSAQTSQVVLKKGMVITQSCTVTSDTYLLEGSSSDVFTDTSGSILCTPVITIEGDNIEVDFKRAQLNGSADPKRPDLFYGVAIQIKGKNITLRNARASGYKVALLANGVENLHLIDCDFSYNYRPRLHSGREHEAFSDWLSYHHNEKDEWLRYGAGIYLKNCLAAEVKGCKVKGNQNALLMTNCQLSLVWNNTFQFNSGLGIGMYRSRNNRIMHNRLDWNVRGYSHGFYERGQDSAGILVYEQSSNNTFAYNSATHSGDGFFLWAGQSTMDTGKGGCNDNMIFGNDFSHAPTNGVEVTFSRNEIRGNMIRECTYGIWGGYSYETTVAGNFIADCKTGIAIEHGQKNNIRQNLFQGDTLGVYLWTNSAPPPADWGFAQQRDTRSRDNVIDRNVFLNVRKPLKISNTTNTAVNGENLFHNFEQLIQTTPKPNEGLSLLRNDIYGTTTRTDDIWKNSELTNSKSLNFTHVGAPEDPYEPLEVPVGELHEPDSLKGGLLTDLPHDFPRGRQFIFVDEWGPYDFRRPIAVIDTIIGDLMALTLLGPTGDWKITNMEGVASINTKSGELPAALIVEKTPGKNQVRIDFEYAGPEVISTVFGEKIPPGQRYKFNFSYFKPKIDWKTSFYAYTDSTDPLKVPDAMAQLKKQTPLHTLSTNDLWFGWWGAPVPNVPADHFATISTTTLEVEPGGYAFVLTSDDGARLYLDGKKLIDHWEVHEPFTDRVSVQLYGKHTLEIEHFDITGFSTLDFRLEKL